MLPVMCRTRLEAAIASSMEPAALPAPVPVEVNATPIPPVARA